MEGGYDERNWKEFDIAILNAYQELTDFSFGNNDKFPKIC